ncbi:MAG: response regulator [Gemmataceae bacterium]
MDSNANILVVDDREANLLAMEELLRPLGQRVVTVGSGAEALRALLEEEFAVILLDVRMPNMDGIETAELIRSRDRCRNTPIIFLTGYARDDAQMYKGYSLGAVDYLSKPIIPEVLRSKVSVLVELFCKTEQVRRQAELLQQQQLREHEAELAREKQRWDIERLRAEAAREKQNATELSRLIAERARAEAQLHVRLLQQALVAELGQQALAHSELPSLMNDVVARVAAAMDLDYCIVMELSAQGALRFSAGIQTTEDVQTRLESWPEVLARRALDLNEPLIIEDLQADPDWQAAHAALGHPVAGALAVTLSHQGSRPQGVLLAHTRQQREFTVDDVHFLKSVAHLLVAARQRHGFEQEITAVKDQLALRLADMTNLHELSARLAQTLEIQAVVDEVLRALLELQGAAAGVLVLHDSASARGRPILASVGLPDNLLAALDASGTDLTSIEELVTGQAETPLRQSLALRSRGGQPIGTLYSSPQTQAESRLPVIELYVHQAAEVIDNAHLYAEIQQANHRKDDFLAMLAHELRNPLAPIRNALSILRIGGNETFLQEARDMAERQLHHLIRLVDDLLDVSRINQGKIHLRLETIEVAEVVRRAIESTRYFIDAHEHQLEVELPPQPVWVEADTTRLEQVLVNLLSNAAKYMLSGGQIYLTVEAGKDSVAVRVRDTGMGIAPELLPQIFELFVQADKSLDRSQGGLGIGLTLVRSLVTLHGGSVEARSAGLGQGSEFTVTLPRAAASPPAAISPSTNNSAHQQRRILVVDDNADAANSLAMLLRVAGHQVRTAHDGPDALADIDQVQPDLVLLDIGLPGLDGLEVARCLRQRFSREELQLIALTGYGHDDVRQRSLEVGFDAHLTKPVEFEELRALIDSRQPV